MNHNTYGNQPKVEKQLFLTKIMQESQNKNTPDDQQPMNYHFSDEGPNNNQI